MSDTGNGSSRGPGFWVWVAFCAALLGVDALHHRHVVHSLEAVFGFYAIYGFAACVSLVLAARVLRRLLMRRADYWDD